MARRAYTLPMRLTDKQARSLRILRDNDVEYPAQFARLAWPDADGWRHSRKCGNHGSAKGMGMYVAAGCHLGILVRLGMITDHPKDAFNLANYARRFSLTADGRRLLDEHEAAQVQSPQVEGSRG